MLSVEEKAAVLDGGIFGDLGEDIRLAVAQRMGQRELADGEPLFLQGEPGDEIFIIVEGQIEINMGKHVVAILEPGQVFGEMAVFGRGRRTAGARAKGTVQLLFLKNQAVRLLIQQAPDLAFEFFKVISDRLEEANHISQFLAEPKVDHGTVEVVEGELAGQSFPINHEDAALGRARGSVADVLRVTIPVTGGDLLDQHARISINGSSVFIEPLDGEVSVNGDPIEDGMEVGPEDTVEVGGLSLRFHSK